VREDGVLDYYELLGVTAESSQEEIHSSYRQRIRTLHPDRFGADGSGVAMAQQMSGLLNLAWETLGSPDARAGYDSRVQREAADHGGAPGTGDDPQLIEVLGDAVGRVGRRAGDPGGLAEIGRALRAGAQTYLGGSADFGNQARAVAVVAGYRDLVADGRRTPHAVRLLEEIAATAVDLLGAPVSLRSRSWVERGLRPATPASPRRRAAQAVSRAGLALVTIAAVATGVDVHDGHGAPWLPFVPDGVAPSAGVAAAASTLLVALVLALATLIASRWLAAGGRPAVAAEPTLTVHLDVADRARFAAGRRFRSLPEHQPEPEPAPASRL
jgi:hypothetical protein